MGGGVSTESIFCAQYGLPPNCGTGTANDRRGLPEQTTLATTATGSPWLPTPTEMSHRVKPTSWAGDPWRTTVTVTAASTLLGNTTIYVPPTSTSNVVESILSAALHTDSTTTGVPLSSSASVPAQMSAQSCAGPERCEPLEVATTFNVSTKPTPVPFFHPSAPAWPPVPANISALSGQHLSGSAAVHPTSVQVKSGLQPASAISALSANFTRSVSTVPSGGHSTSVSIKSGLQPASVMSALSASATKSTSTLPGLVTSLSTSILLSPLPYAPVVTANPAGLVTGVPAAPSCTSGADMTALTPLLALLEGAADFEISVDYNVLDKSGDHFTGTYNEVKNGLYSFGENSLNNVNGTAATVAASAWYSTTSSFSGPASGAAPTGTDSMGTLNRTFTTYEWKSGKESSTLKTFQAKPSKGN